MFLYCFLNLFFTKCFFQDLEVEDRTHFAIINPRTAAPTVAVRICHTVFVLLKYSVREGPQRAPYLHQNYVCVTVDCLNLMPQFRIEVYGKATYIKNFW